MEGSAQRPAGTSTAALVGVLLAGSLVAVAVGVYGQLHEPTGRPLFTLWFSGMINLKVWFTTAAAVGALVQVSTALRMFGHLGSGPAPSWVPVVHRTSGVITFLLTLPVAAHCLWSLGYQTYDARVAWHSGIATLFYGAYVSKILSLHVRGVPAWAVPVLGGTLFASLVALWATSALWFFTNVAFPGF